MKTRGLSFSSPGWFGTQAWLRWLSCLSAIVASFSLSQNFAQAQSPQSTNQTPVPEGMQVATVAGGCFWCVEAVFENVPGVKDVVSGYAGGTVANPTYEQVCTKLTGHAEVCQITFDPEKISYLRILEIFTKTHDPTTLNKQGPDRGPQYRSSIFYHNDEQKQQAEELIKRLNEEKVYDDKIVTKLEPLTAFYRAEEYHQDYYRKNPGDGYCMMNARPKVMKLKKVMQELEKKDKAAK